MMTFSKQDGTIELPIDHNHMLQSFLYRNISDDQYRDFLHEQGYSFEKRKFKGFTFSRLDSTYIVDRKRGVICFRSPVTWVVTAATESFIRDLMTTLLKQNQFKWYDQKVHLESLYTEAIPNVTSPTLVRTLSPITMYTTIIDENRNKRTHYYHCEDQAFSALIQQNLIKKYVALHGTEPENNSFSISPVRIKQRPETVKFKRFIIKGWKGEFLCTGSPELIQFALKVGVGAKSSQGFGCIEI
ncbi:CRISPR-associated endoribonuclease Cas6 [Kroppenstedtia sanguinis]|uniref:CRISPR-associated endoribonuclease n=1 Tax=Kroppenstedtia sanguinis TaxID=1380684 RepID=A0ABW4C6X2_9BACL